MRYCMIKGCFCKHATEFGYCKYTACIRRIEDAEVHSAESNILDDGTLTITVQHGMLSKVNRVIVDEVGTKFCKMMYQDALDVRENMKGEWILIDPDIIFPWKCSRCGSSADTPYEFCPECGTRMNRV